MGYKTLCFTFSCILFAYYVYSPLPENIEEPWKVRFMDSLIKITSLVATLLENVGLMKGNELFLTLATIHFIKPVSEENITVIDTNFSDIPVRLYLPKRKSERQRPAVIFIHGGAFVFGSFKMSAYDDLNRWTANKLNAVVVGVDYRLAPQHPFPAALEVCIFVTKFFLQDKVLAEYGVDTTRICLTGESSGGTLVATVVQLATLFENIGLMKYEELFSIISAMYFTKPVSDENITVIDTNFSDIPVRLYLPKRKSERQRPAVIHIHGGAFVLGSCNMSTYDDLNRWTANKLNAVVLGINYRLAPQYPFPAALEDCMFVIKFFLQDKVLAEYGVDTTRICIMGDSSGGTLAATVVQLLQNDAEYKDRIKAQALIYPALQLIDILLPSHREYGHGPIVYRKMLIKLACLYVSEDKDLVQAALRNEHMPEGSRHLFKFVNWSDFLPEKFKRNHVYTEPILGKLKDSYPALEDSRASPLLANDSQLQSLPLTYILTCEHDLIRDDGLMYVTQLRNVGVPVTHDHIEEGIHGAMSFTKAPLFLHLGLKIRDRYISWLEENL